MFLKILMGPQVPRIPAVNAGVYATLRDVITLKLLGNSSLALTFGRFDHGSEKVVRCYSW